MTLFLLATDPDAHVLQQLLPGVQLLGADQLEQLPAEALLLADVDVYLQHRWSCPTVVLAGPTQGHALADAWAAGAVAGWIRQQWPTQPEQVLAELLLRQRARLDCQELPDAAQFQQQLLPSDPQLPGYAVYRAYQPASFLSGDWVDGWFVSEHQYLCYLADVAGHGLTSSLLTPWLACFHRSSQHPIDLLNQINQKLIEQKISRHITAIAVLLDCQQHRIQWCSAGHYPGPIVIAPDRSIQLLKSSSLPLGLSDWVSFELNTLDLLPHSRVILSSDGTLELFSGPLQQRLQQLAEQLANYRFIPQRAPEDDVTLFCIHRLGDGP